MWAIFRSKGRRAVSATTMMDTQSSDVAQRSVQAEVSIVLLYWEINDEGDNRRLLTNSKAVP